MSTKKTAAETKEQRLPPLVDGQLVRFASVTVVERKTRPPASYTEGSLIDDMKAAGKFVEDPELRKVLKDTSGLGTSATRDSIIEVLKAHKYIEKSGQSLCPTDKGTRFILWLEEVCPDLADIALTARWEAKLDLVAKNGGGAAFEAEVAARVRELVTVLKSVPPLTTPQSKENSMSDEQPRRASKPTEKMLDFAKRIAERLGQTLGDAEMADFDACSAFIEANKAAATRPTEKQLAFATRIAKDKGLTIPPDAMAEGRVLSRWIDDNK